MKKYQFLLAMMAILFMATGCEVNHEKMLTVEQLPEAAQAYIKENVLDAKPLFVKKKREAFNTTYEVQFDNRLELEFNEKGELIDAELDD